LRHDYKARNPFDDALEETGKASATEILSLLRSFQILNMWMGWTTPSAQPMTGQG
jgi:hypothetical protein